ncbi:hypothetical protein [Nocardia sp. NPDC050413]|uniref:hypothetical protein n=1 Tax=Nocardia sp. NPDC050413 TaxID=3155784 RepID=UPI003404CDA2
MSSPVVLVIGLLGLVLVVWLVWLIVRSSRERRRQRVVDQLLSVAASGDTARLREIVETGAYINTVAAQGNSALHLAYYTGQQEAIENLRAYGADANLRNNEGLTPAEMSSLAHIENLLREGAWYLNRDGSWRDRGQGYRVYTRLGQFPERIYNPAVVRQVLRREQRRELLILAIKLGRTGSEEKLAEALQAFGDKHMAEDYLNCGSRFLHDAAEQWARANNYRIFSRSGWANVGWGRF